MWRAAGLTHAQGFLLGRPAPASEIRFDATDRTIAGEAAAAERELIGT
ncbi:MAG TPA: hypothetical protein VGH49_05600 [Xanthobacteraceae bacterium]